MDKKMYCVLCGNRAETRIKSGLFICVSCLKEGRFKEATQKSLNGQHCNNCYYSVEYGNEGTLFCTRIPFKMNEVENKQYCDSWKLTDKK